MFGVGLGVREHFLTRHTFARLAAPAGVADEAGEISNQKNDRVPEVLKLPQLAQSDRMTEVNIGRRRVEPLLDDQRLAAVD